MSEGVHYRTLAGHGQTSFEIRGSTFIGQAGPARSVTEAETFLDRLEETYPEATHVVPAYRIRDGDLVREWSSDDGEPTGSAGAPALNVLQQRELENTVLGIVRFFGGTELGIGGLARAYARGAKEAVEAAEIVRTEPHDRFHVSVCYDDSGTVRGLLESADLDFEASYDERVTFQGWVAVSCADGLADRVLSATNGRAVIERDESDSMPSEWTDRA